MATLLTESAIKRLLNSGVIENGKEGNAEGIKYDFSISSRILKSSYKSPIDINHLTEKERADIVVEPGEVVFVLTEESLNLPKDLYATLVPKRKMGHEGIMVLGGLSVDPYYKGRLLIGLYNFSSSSFPIQPGKKVIGAHFFQLSNDEIVEGIAHETSINEFPNDLVRLMQQYTPVSLQGLKDKIIALDVKIEDLSREVRDDWFIKFQDSLDDQNQKINNILKTIEKEVIERKDSEKTLEIKILETYNKTNETISKLSYKMVRNAIWFGVIIGIILPFLYWFFTQFNIIKK